MDSFYYDIMCIISTFTTVKGTLLNLIRILYHKSQLRVVQLVNFMLRVFQLLGLHVVVF